MTFRSILFSGALILAPVIGNASQSPKYSPPKTASVVKCQKALTEKNETFDRQEGNKKELFTSVFENENLHSPSIINPPKVSHFHFTQVLNNDDHYREHVFVGDIDSALIEREIMIQGIQERMTPLAEGKLRREKILFQDSPDEHPFIYQTCFQNRSNETFDAIQCDELINMACAKIFKGAKVKHCKEFPEIIRGHIISEGRKKRTDWIAEINQCQNEVALHFKGFDLPGLMPPCQDLLAEACNDSFHYYEFKDFCQSQINIHESNAELAAQILPPDDGEGFMTEKLLESLVERAFQSQAQTQTKEHMVKGSDLLQFKNPLLLPPQDLKNISIPEEALFSDFGSQFIFSMNKLMQNRPEEAQTSETPLGGLLTHMYPLNIVVREEIRDRFIRGTCDKETLCRSFKLDGLECNDAELGRRLAKIHAQYVESLGVPNLYVPIRLFKQTSFWPESSYLYFHQFIAPSLFHEDAWLDAFPKDENSRLMTQRLSPSPKPSLLSSLPSAPLDSPSSSSTTPSSASSASSAPTATSALVSENSPAMEEISVSLRNPRSAAYWEYEVSYWEAGERVKVVIGICMQEPCARAGGGPAKRGEILSLFPKCGPQFYTTPPYPAVLLSRAPYTLSPCR